MTTHADLACSMDSVNVGTDVCDWKTQTRIIPAGEPQGEMVKYSSPTPTNILMPITPNSLGVNHRVIHQDLNPYNWQTQTRFIDRVKIEPCTLSTWMGTDTGTKTHSGNWIFSDDDDTD